MKVGFFAGSFDPFTNGHLHVVSESLKLFDKVVVGIAVNPDKTRRFDKFLMKQAIDEVFKTNTKVSCVVYDGLTVDEAKKHNSTMLVRGVRNEKDFLNEEKLAEANKKLSGLETIYIRTGELADISSTMVFNKIQNNEDVSNLVPKEIFDAIKK